MPERFADNTFYAALLFRRDALHTAAIELVAALEGEPGSRLVTTDAVLMELLAFTASLGAENRRRCAEFVERIRASSDVVVLHASGELFDRGLDLYKRRLDKDYSLCDCISMVVCRDRGITEVLTHDHDFEQEGFTILL